MSLGRYFSQQEPQEEDQDYIPKPSWADSIRRNSRQADGGTSVMVICRSGGVGFWPSNLTTPSVSKMTSRRSTLGSIFPLLASSLRSNLPPMLRRDGAEGILKLNLNSPNDCNDVMEFLLSALL
jgi:hypothetical protein